MLDPTTLETLHDAIRPPDGFTLSEGIVTTFSLDLVALLAAPLGFVATTVSADLRSQWTVDTQLTVLRALQETARRLTVFCDAGHIAVPKHGQTLMAMLEPAVVIARAPKAMGAFHPKVWVLRFVHASDTEVVHYRLLVLTRNLTFDRSLDLIARLDGERRTSTVAARSALPIRAFVQSLLGVPVHPIDQHHRDRIERLADEVGRCDFVASAPFDAGSWRFLSFGLPHARDVSPLTAPVKRRLIVSPFLSDKAVRQGMDGAGQTIIISRDTAFAELDASTLKSAVALLVPRRVLTEAASAEAEPFAETSDRVQPGDLHAKAYIHEDGSATATWFVGSANATASAFIRNVEVLLELRGPRQRVGIDTLLPVPELSLLASSSKPQKVQASTPLVRNPTFVDLWEAYEPAVAPDDGLLAEMRKNQDAADALARTLTALPWRSVVEVLDGGYGLALQLADDKEYAIEEASVEVRPLTVTEARAMPDSTFNSLRWAPLAIESLTEFWPTSVVTGSGAAQARREFLLKAPMVGAPDGREAAVTRSLLTDADRVRRFLELLLSNDQDDVDNASLDGREATADTPGVGTMGGASLLEPFLRAFSRQPQRVVEAGRIIEDLASTEKGRACLPAGLSELWVSFRSALEAEGLWCTPSATLEQPA